MKLVWINRCDSPWDCVPSITEVSGCSGRRNWSRSSGGGCRVWASRGWSWSRRSGIDFRIVWGLYCLCSGRRACAAVRRVAHPLVALGAYPGISGVRLTHAIRRFVRRFLREPLRSWSLVSRYFRRPPPELLLALPVLSVSLPLPDLAIAPSLGPCLYPCPCRSFQALRLQPSVC
jgi:hypothetical protein